MIFTSFSFIIFLTCVVVIYFLCPAKYRWTVLLIGSLIFYGMASKKFLPFIIATAAVSYLAARLMHKINADNTEKISHLEDKKEIQALKQKSQRDCRKIVTVAIIFIIGYLACTKFGNTVIEWLRQSSGNTEQPVLSAISIIVPLGISYYSFSTVGYMLDVYWKRYEPEKNFFKYLLYVIYFPHILQGPIARYNRLGIQFSQEHRFDYKRVCFGVQLILWGFFQKLVIADRLAIFINAVYKDYMNQCGSILFLATLLYAVQIYTDFAGCVNIARGTSQIFGIELEDNFRQPYFSQSVDEFWRRWHITLGAWFKDYLCMPITIAKPVKNLSKSVKDKFGLEASKKVTMMIALIAVWICTGVWHGTGLNYVAWGIWQGGIIIFSLLMEPLYVKTRKYLNIKDTAIEWKAFRILRTFILTGIIPRVIVRAGTLDAAWVIFGKFFRDLQISALWNGQVFNYGLSKIHFVIAVMAILILLIVSVLKENGISIRERIADMNIVVRWFIYIAAFYAVVLFGIYGPGYDASAFVYMGF